MVRVWQKLLGMCENHRLGTKNHDAILCPCDIGHWTLSCTTAVTDLSQFPGHCAHAIQLEAGKFMNPDTQLVCS